MIGLLATAIFDLKFEPKFKFGLNPAVLKNWRSCFKSPIFWSISLIFFIPFVGILNSENLPYWLERIRIKLPFLLLPLAFYFLPRFNKKDLLKIFYFLIAFLFITCIAVLFNYYSNFEEFNLLVERGKHIPVPRNHVRFSLLLAISILLGFNIVLSKAIIKWNVERYVILFMSLFLFTTLHILSVKSGLLILYVGLLVAVIRYVILEKKYLFGLLGLLFLMCIPVLVYNFVPSFQNKINYFNYDVQAYLKGNTDNQRSDTGRLRSIKIGYDVFKTSPIVGVGPGDLKKEVYAVYDKDYPKAYKKVMPHNQFLSVAAGSGLIGLAVFLAALFYPLLYQKNWKDRFLLVFFISIVLSFLVENTIGNSTGVGIHAFFVLLMINHLNHPSLKKTN